MAPSCGTLLCLFLLLILLDHTVYGLSYVRLLRTRPLRAPSALKSLGWNIGNIGNMGSTGKPQQPTPPTPESTLTPFEQAVQLKTMDMDMDMKRMEMEMKRMEMEMKIEMMKKDKDMAMQIIAVLGFIIGVVIFSICIKDGLLGNRVNSVLAWLQAGATKNKLLLSAWVGASIADKVSQIVNSIWNIVFLKKSLAVPKLF